MGLSIKVDTSGMDRLKRNIAKLGGERKVRATDFLPSRFMSRFTEFPDLQAMLDASGVDDAEELKGKAFSQFVAKHTNFADWDEMLQAGLRDYATRSLNS